MIIWPRPDADPPFLWSGLVAAGIHSSPSTGKRDGWIWCSLFQRTLPGISLRLPALVHPHPDKGQSTSDADCPTGKVPRGLWSRPHRATVLLVAARCRVQKLIRSMGASNTAVQSKERSQESQKATFLLLPTISPLKPESFRS